MSDEVLKVKITRKLIEDLYAFHGMNVFAELRRVAEERTKLNNNEKYEFVVGTKILDQWVPERTLSQKEIQEVEELINNISRTRTDLADANLQLADKLNELFKPVCLADIIKTKKKKDKKHDTDVCK